MNLLPILVAFIAASRAPSAGQAEPKNPAPPAQTTSLAAERRELAEIQLLLGAERKYAEAKERLTKLAEALAARTDAEATLLLDQVRKLERSVRRALGEPVVEDLSLVVDVTARQKGDTVDEAVLAALARNDYSFPDELGTRAGPGLARYVREAPDELPGDVTHDALYLLLKLDPRRGDELLRELLDHDSFFWRKRVVRSLRETPWDSRALFSTETPRRWLGVGIQQTLEKYAEDPDVGNSALVQLGVLSNGGTQSEALFRLVAEGLRSPDSVRREAAKKVAKNHPFEPMRPVLEAALENGDADLRTFASRELCEHEESRALLAHADDPEPEVRKAILRRLEKSDARNWQREEPAVLARLLMDADESVQQQALYVLSNLPTGEVTTTLPTERGLTGKPLEFKREEYLAPLPDDVYRSLLKRPEAKQRAQLAAKARYLPAPLCFELLAALAGDSETDVLVHVEQVMVDLPFWEDPEAMLRLASVLRDKPGLPDQGWTGGALRRLTETRAGLAALARWIVARNETELHEWVDLGNLAKIEGGPFADYVTWLFERKLLVWDQLRGRTEPAAMRVLAEDRSRPLALRLFVLGMLCRVDGQERLELTLHQVLADPGWSALDPAWGNWLAVELRNLLRQLTGEACNRAIAVMLDNAAMPEWLSVDPISAFDKRAEGATAIGKRVLERWFPRADQSNTDQNAAVREAILAMASNPELRDDRVLAAATQRSAYASTAWDTIAWLKDPVFLPLIREALERSGDSKAAEALFGYLSDEAAELLLLAAAKVKTTELRDKCLEHLEKIREYQDSRERWATRKVKTQTREQVLAQLVEQLGAKSDDVKVQAIRALATWEAVEVMPKLIELTTSPSKSVASAAREALERLNAPKKD